MTGQNRQLRRGIRLNQITTAGLLLFSMALPLTAQLEIKSTVANKLTYRADNIPSGPGGLPAGDHPAITPQYANVVETSSSSGPISASSELTSRYPGSGPVILFRASTGHAFSSGVPRYFLGDRIVAPNNYLSPQGTLIQISADFWRTEPVRAGEIVINPSGDPLTDATGAAIANDGGVIVPILETDTYETFYYSPHAKAIFACQPGQVQIWWRSRLPDPAGNYVLVREVFAVSSATSKPIRTLYWTEKSFSGPRITIPSGRIEAVNPVYSNVFPPSVSTEYTPVGNSPPADPDVQSASELRTVWFDKNNGIGELHAYNISGRILVEYLGALREDGTHEFLGADVVEVSQSAPSSTLTVFLGKELRPVTEDWALQALPTQSTSSNSTSWYGSFVRADGSLAYFAERENAIEDRLVFYWMERLDASIPPASGLAPGLELEWPKYLHKYLQVWPEDIGQYAHYTVANGGSSTITGTGLKFEGGKIPDLIYQDAPAQDEAILDPPSQRLFISLSGDQINRTLLKFTGDNGGIWYVRLMTQADSRDGFIEGDSGAPLSGTAYVGQRIHPPSASYSSAGYIAEGSAYSTSAYRDPFQFGVTDAEQGAIIPVNALPDDASQLTIWWFSKVSAPSAEFTDFYTPAKIGRYTLEYSNDDPFIVLASNSGSGDLSPAQSAGFIYTQNDSTMPGYNPNEEHAILLGDRAYALRDDLNITSVNNFTSLPRVLIQYADPVDNRPAMAAWQVVREDDVHTFEYTVTAGTILNSPMPLPRLPLPVDPATGLSRNTEVITGAPEPFHNEAPSYYEKFTFKDRKGYDWVYRGPHDDGNPGMGMRFYYTMRDGFFIPGRTLANQPATGTILPYLRPQNADGSFSGDPVSGTPITVVYRPVWPDHAPTMSVGETLTLPKYGLPAVRGQSSATVLYQQSIAQSGPENASVTLHDPTRAKTVLLNAAGIGLSELPASLATTSQAGKTYFQLLSPHLQQRFYYDPTLGEVGGLMLIGEFVDEPAGEDYLHLNALSSGDITVLKALVSNTDTDAEAWYKAIDGLRTRVETFIEDPVKQGIYIVDSTRTVTVDNNELAVITDSDTAVDSYALTATGAGGGFASLLFGNGSAFTPEGDPVSISIIQIAPQLYTGDLKMLPASNPLDEQSTLRHSGDFAARPGDYEFDWRYAAPQNGTAPAVYTYAMDTVLGMPGTNQWQLLANPAAPLPESSAYPSASVEFARTFAVNSNGYDIASGLPGTVARATSSAHFENSVPSQIVFSADLGTRDGFVLYVNRIPALASSLPDGFSVPGNLPLTGARTGLSSNGLDYQYQVSSSYFTTGDNLIEVAFYSDAANGISSTIDLQLDASIETDHVVATGSPWLQPNGELSNIVVVGGSADSPLGNPILVFSDNYFTMRYRAKPGTDTIAGESWSRWMQPQLVESWIKRALDGINPFTQRNTDLFNNPVSTDVSILTQAGPRWEGDVALNLDNINDFGLIEIYETLLNRARSLSIDAGYDDSGTNDTLLLVAGYLNDLYMTVGNEASDDADNPTIAIDGESGAEEISTSRFSFEGQLSSLLDEELTLLRGRDDFLSPSVTTAPAYNRLYWNYINGVDSGESIYALNYDIQEKAGSPTADGTLDADDALYMFPQGHGDAYGHYLTALTGYYKLLTSPFFTWTPRSEGVSVLGQTVQVDYQDERKFAAAAANVARVAARILDLTARQSYRDDPSTGWAHQRDGKYNSNTGITRHWGTDEWASRGGQGAYFHWINANAMLPDVDNNPQHHGIQIIDRTTVPEIAEIITSAIEIQATLDAQCAHLNPLGLAKGAMSFDISPTALKAGQSHYEQIYTRALQASLNASAAFEQASRMNRLLRNQNHSLNDYNNAVEDQERTYEYELITLFGSAYSGDIGPGKLYEQGYTGPDLYRYYFIDQPSVLTDTLSDLTVTFREPIEMNPFTEWSLDNVYNKINDPLQYTTRTFTIAPHQLMQFATEDMGSRSEPGAIQTALLDVYKAQVNAREAADQLDGFMRRFERDYQLFTEFRTAYDDANAGAAAKLDEASAKLKAATVYSASSTLLEISADFITAIAEATAEAFPTVVGFSMDATSVARSLSVYGGVTAAYAQQLSSLALETKAAYLELEADLLAADAEDFFAAYEWENEDKQHVAEFERLLDEILGTGFELSRRLTELQHANEQASRLIARGNRILTERETFRQRAAAVIQGYRTRDMTYRTFRNEALSQYQALYDLAAQFSYLAMQSYDYETGLLGTSAGQSLIDGIISTRSLGEFKNGHPVAASSTAGDGGIASLMARLQSDWSVVKTRLGINNPDQYGTLFSLRQELFRISRESSTTEDDKAWTQVLEQHIMNDLLSDPDVALYCRNIRNPTGSTVPGIVIPFSSTIAHNLNFFGLPLAAGDHAYTPTSFATKIYATGVVLEGYVGMDPYAIGVPNAGGSASPDSDALSATPYVYLIPTGQDHMLAPPLGDTTTVRSWAIKDQAIPLPFNLGQNDFSSTQFFTPDGTVNEQLWILRKHQAFRPVNDAAFFYSTLPSEFTNTRLIGRSVWNTQWKLVIPAYTLLSDHQTGLDRFVRTVSDIRLFFRTYSHSGN